MNATQSDVPSSELIFDHALDYAAERLANPDGCQCTRCQDAEIETRRELIAEGERRISVGNEIRATIKGRLS